jgi:hypothetical protein
LEELWKQLPSLTRQELLGRLTRMLAQRLAPSNQYDKEDADEQDA